MRVIVLIKATENFRGGQAPSEELFTEMIQYNEQLVKAASC
jgi:hypothetical protein